MSTPSGLVAFDLETTGISPRRDRIIEIGAVRFDRSGTVDQRLELTVNPGRRVPLVIQRLVGLSDADLAEAPSPVEAVAQLADLCEGCQLVAHGGSFDIAFCAAVLPDAFRNRDHLDTLELARILLPVARSHSLPVLSGHLGLGHDRPHRALSDAEATRQLLLHLVEVGEGLPSGVLAEMRRVAAQAGGALAAFFADLVRGRGGPVRPAPEPREVAPRSLTLARTTSGSAGLAAAAAAHLGQDGPLARRLPGHEHRESQVQMARAVSQALERRRRLLVEAGTGVGKSLAYLVPLALWASRTGGRAVVATHTVNLQEQLAETDLPSLAAAPGEPTEAPVTYAVLKGRQHYLSLRRWQRFLAQPDLHPRGPDLDSIRFKLKLLAWLATTRTGDRSELRLTAAEEALWRAVESDAGDCLGRACANWGTARCFMVAARRAAEAASLVIANHALLLSDAGREGRVLAPFEALVVDEAHHLEASATRQLGLRLRAADLAVILDRLPALGDPVLATVLSGCREAAQRLFGEVKGFCGERLGGDHSGNGLVGLSDELRRERSFAGLLRSASHGITGLRGAARELRTAAEREPLQAALIPQPGGAADDLRLAAAALEDLAAGIERVLCAPRPDEVTWLELRAEQAELRSAPVSVAAALGESVFARVEAAVLTSATLSVAGSFDFVRSRVGIGAGAEELALDSPFDYYAQAVCLLPTDMPPYDDPGYERALAAMLGDLAVRLGGRTLALFTGYGPLQRVHRLLAGSLDERGVAVVGQGIDGTRRQVLRTFVDDPRTLLLATSSFWEGVDLPGDLLRCVVIAKLPFAVPTDPLVRARTEQLADPFSDFVLPLAVIRLRQGFGRLIRGSADRGAVVLCDSRLGTRDYASRFFESLPPAELRRCSVDEVGRLVERFVELGAPAGARG